LKINKTPGEDGITWELLKNMGNELTEYIYLLVKEIWEKEVIPEDWKKIDRRLTKYSYQD